MEGVAVVLALVYLVLAIRENPWCWPAGLLSSLLYGLVFAGARLYMEAGLQVFYAVLAVYGWWAWSGRAGRPVLNIQRWPGQWHAGLGALVGLAAGASGWWLSTHSNAALPYLDAFTTWSAVVATFLTARKVLENWLWWLVIDGVSLGVYLNRGLWLTAGLFGVYLVLIVVGYRQWQRA